MVVHLARSIVVDEVNTFVCDKQAGILAFDRWSFIRLALLQIGGLGTPRPTGLNVPRKVRGVDNTVNKHVGIY